MKNKQIHKKRFLYIVLTMLLLVVSVFGGQAIMPAFADTGQYTNVIEDLSKDSNFNSKDYPIIADDYSLQVIQVAESVDNELFIYVYQPSSYVGDLMATDINMSLTEEAADTELYKLDLISSVGVFYKYLVERLTVSEASTRYYNISSIYRAWDKDKDEGTGNNNTLNKKAFAVGKLFEARTVNGEVIYTLNPTYVVQIIKPYSDYLTYVDYGGVKLPSLQFSMNKWGMIDAHYIAFSTDLRIDKLRSATVSYSYCPGKGYYDKYLWFNIGNDVSYGTEQTTYAYPTYLDKFKQEGSVNGGVVKYSYSWDRIQTVSEFISSENNLTDETKENLSGKQWVLRFVETQRTQTETNVLGYKKYETEFTKVSNVSVLRLEFETDGVVYNLGAVSDTVSGDEKPGNVDPKPENKSFWDKVAEFFEKLLGKLKNIPWWQWVLIGLGVILCAGVIIAIIIFGVQAVFKFIWWLIRKLLQGLWWLITLPFRLISKAIKNRKKSKKSKSKKEQETSAESEEESDD